MAADGAAFGAAGGVVEGRFGCVVQEAGDEA